MNKVTTISLLAVFVICSFYQKDFEILNRYSWRCKEKLKHQRNEDNHGNHSVSNNCNTVNLVRNEIVNNDCPKCICGKMQRTSWSQSISEIMKSDYIFKQRQYRRRQYRTKYNRKPLRNSNQIAMKMSSLLLKKELNYQSHLRIGAELIRIFTQNYRQST